VRECVSGHRDGRYYIEVHIIEEREGKREGESRRIAVVKYKKAMMIQREENWFVSWLMSE